MHIRIQSWHKRHWPILHVQSSQCFGSVYESARLACNGSTPIRRHISAISGSSHLATLHLRLERPLTFNRSNPYALSSEFLERLANGAGAMRWYGAVEFGLIEHDRAVGDTSDYRFLVEQCLLN